MTVMRAALLALLVLTTPCLSEDAADPMKILAERTALCDRDPGSSACSLAEGRAIALVANSIAEAGQTRDRGAYVDLVRRYLASDEPELRAAAAYALAKLAPDAADTEVLITLLQDPVSAVRDGAWAASGASSDGRARLVMERFPDRVERNGYWPDPEPFDAASLGVALPEGLDFLWISAPRRTAGQIQFLAGPDRQALAQVFAMQFGQPEMTPDDALQRWPMVSSGLMAFQDQRLFGSVTVVPMLAQGAETPEAFALIYDDLLFARTGVTLLWADGRDLVPVPPAVAEAKAEDAVSLTDEVDALDLALKAHPIAKPDAPAEETDLYRAILASGGAAAEDYLELYPDGAYAAEVQALIVAPRLVLDAVRYSEIGPIMAEIQNLPQGSNAELVLQGPEGSFGFARLGEGQPSPVAIDFADLLAPGVYRARATIQLAEGGLPLVLWRDFSVEQAMAELTLAKTEFAPGEMISVSFKGMFGSDQDYVSTALAGSPNSAYLAYVYTSAAQDGMVSLAAPSDPGSYEIRAFFREDETVLRGSVPFVVKGAPTVATATTTTTPATGASAADDGARATLLIDKATYAPGAAITVTYSGMSGAKNDYVSTAPAGSSATSYLQYVYTDGATEGSVTLAAPSDPGAYEIRAFFREDESILRGSVPFLVEGTATGDADARATLALDRQSYAPGAPISVTFAGMSGGEGDYVSVAPFGAPNSSYLQYAYTTPATEGVATLAAPVEPGTYEVRAFFREDETILRGSVSFQVE